MAIIKKFRIKSFKKKKSILKLDNVSLSFGKRQILENINFEINKGEIFGMLGPNGVGKSTIFNLITGLISPEKGSIFISGEKVNNFPIFLRTTRFKIGYVPQYGGYFYDLYGSYDYAFYIAIALSIFATFIHYPIDERPLVRERTTS